MRAVEVSQYGGPEVLQVVDKPAPTLREGQVRVAVKAIGVNYLDIQERTGAYPRSLPYVPGDEGSGTIIEVGQGVDRLPGERVCWQGITGSYAEELAIPADRLIAVPDGISDHLAAALPTQGLTAHYLATDAYQVGPGDTVVILAGAGGVGLLLTQIAKLQGACVITAVSTPEKAELSRTAGADRVISYEELKGTAASVIYDSVGASTFEDSLAALERRGTLVLYGQSSGPVPAFDLMRLRHGSLTVIRPTLRDYVAGDELQRRAADLFAWIGHGQVTPQLGAVYPLGDVAQAQADLEGRRTTGKLLLVP
ncbi:quinone oxidoreductase family protein [Kribbella italica]|uniref:NADPH2:quinone reductase n=1 Tax=Kribbella italica TaxID=1540520 RepID=A0A7W9J1Q8_9ACTN|nr:quinone oxidoreductase [Kribbella italica]MBB5833530.1 NADPH2:quinone reductase [Kribbella italica]